jgi:hypothetical protein
VQETRRPILWWWWGGFNILRFGSEKNKVFHPNKFSDIFNNIIHVHGLREIDISGGMYTWSNN